MKKIIFIAMILISVFALSLVLQNVRGQTPMEKLFMERKDCHNGDLHGCRPFQCCNEINCEKQPPKSSPAPPAIVQSLPQLDSQWTSVVGYSSSFSQCSNLCQKFQSDNCNLQDAVSYCSKVVSVDLNKDGKIDASQIGTGPAGTVNCETNARCYDVIKTCQCKNLQLDFNQCISIFYQTYTASGMNATSALATVKQNTVGSCQSPQT